MDLKQKIIFVILMGILCLYIYALHKEREREKHIDKKLTYKKEDEEDK